MKLIVGLGNPGVEYLRTRHNIGRRLIERVVANNKTALSNKRSLKALVAQVTWAGETVHLACPLSYMNLSGMSVKALRDGLGIRSLKDLLIVVDDFALPFGRLRLRGSGSGGGHNGLFSIEEALGSRDYPRLRMGIGLREQLANEAPETGTWHRDFVLSDFTREEEDLMESFLKRGEEACRLWMSEPLATSMNRVNVRERP
ncbi:MAG: aminoacyl-tRNA hydrolase [Candidatus Omnitrophica bacterium]|nr:aminoacyl-tRNA hydrolase [Candidatus Omnitrophota bacterium]